MTTKIDPSKYVSTMAKFLKDPGRVKAEQFADAATHIAEGMTLHVGIRGTWHGTFDNEPGRLVQSYERIGYHSGAEWLVEGFLLAGGKVFFHGFDGIEGEVSL